MYLHQSLQAWKSVIAVLHFLYSSEVDMSINVQKLHCGDVKVPQLEGCIVRQELVSGVHLENAFHVVKDHVPLRPRMTSKSG